MFPSLLKKLSFKAYGTPASGPTSSPAAIFLSISSAFFRAFSSSASETKTLYFANWRAFSKASFTRLTAEICLLAIFILVFLFLISEILDVQ